VYLKPELLVSCLFFTLSFPPSYLSCSAERAFLLSPVPVPCPSCPEAFRSRNFHVKTSQNSSLIYFLIFCGSVTPSSRRVYLGAFSGPFLSFLYLIFWHRPYLSFFSLASLLPPIKKSPSGGSFNGTVSFPPPPEALGRPKCNYFSRPLSLFPFRL